MKELKYTLIADGSSDKTLLLIIKWLLDDLYPELPNQGNFADFRHIHRPPKSIKDKVKTASMYFPFDVLFIHRDAEKTDIEIIKKRISEIKKELHEDTLEKIICVIPVKMMESWLLFNMEAIKMAAGNRNYNGNIILPHINIIEKEKQPKVILHKILIEASGLKGRKLKRFNIDKAVHLVVENIDDFSPLRNLEAFKIFEKDLKEKIDYFLNNNS